MKTLWCLTKDKAAFITQLPQPMAFTAGWRSLVSRRAHNPKVAGSNPAPATKNLTQAIFFKIQDDSQPEILVVVC